MFTPLDAQRLLDAVEAINTTDCCLIVQRCGPDIIVALDPDGYVALHWATYRNRVHILYWFLQHRIDVNMQHKDRTALMIAAYHGHAECARALLRARANPSIKDKDGSTALDIARHRRHREVVALLEDVLLPSELSVFQRFWRFLTESSSEQEDAPVEGTATMTTSAASATLTGFLAMVILLKDGQLCNANESSFALSDNSGVKPAVSSDFRSRIRGSGPDQSRDGRAHFNEGGDRSSFDSANRAISTAGTFLFCALSRDVLGGSQDPAPGSRCLTVFSQDWRSNNCVCLECSDSSEFFDSPCRQMGCASCCSVVEGSAPRCAPFQVSASWSHRTHARAHDRGRFCRDGHCASQSTQTAARKSESSDLCTQAG
eukprot:m.521538 g.521538  ORF g.521538 m.521538 type:complete len:373 (+) comp57504_c0_seq22:751-1869(+)